MKPALETLAEEVFRDPVIQEVTIDQPLNLFFDWLVEVGYRPGVTDNIGRTAREAVERHAQHAERGPQAEFTAGNLYFFKGRLTRDEVSHIAKDLLANDLIQTSQVFSPSDDRSLINVPIVKSKAEILVREINLDRSDDELCRISREGVLALNLEEMKTIQRFFNRVRNL